MNHKPAVYTVALSILAELHSHIMLMFIHPTENKLDGTKIRDLARDAFNLARSRRSGKHGQALALQDTFVSAIKKSLTTTLSNRGLRGQYMLDMFFGNHHNTTSDHVQDFIMNSVQKHTTKEGWTFPVAAEKVVNDLMVLCYLLKTDPDTFENNIISMSIHNAEKLAELTLLAHAEENIRKMEQQADPKLYNRG